MKNKKIEQVQKTGTFKLIPGTFCKCYYCDVDNKYCKKYKKIKDGIGGIGDYTWENYCLKDGGCDK